MVTPDTVELILALKILRECFTDDGKVRLNPATGQFLPVDKPKDAETILGAVDRILHEAAKGPVILD